MSHTSIEGHVEHIQPAKDKEIPESVSQVISQALIQYDQPGTDNIIMISQVLIIYDPPAANQIGTTRCSLGGMTDFYPTSIFSNCHKYILLV